MSRTEKKSNFGSTESSRRTAHAKALSTLSQKSETVAENGDSRTFLRHCGQGLTNTIRQRQLDYLGHMTRCSLEIIV